LVNYQTVGGAWGLSVIDDGIGLPTQAEGGSADGLGTGIIEVLARQLGAEISTTAGPHGTTVKILSKTPAGGHA
jgi:two-component sensor histidine kinase